MFDEHLTPVLSACSEAELAVLIEFLGRPPSGLLWLDRRVGGRSREAQVAAVTERILRLGGHSVLGRTGPGEPSYLQIVCDALAELGLSEEPADGIVALETRVVQYALDAGFGALPEELQAALLARFESGALFVDGVPDLSVLHDFITHVGPERRGLVVAHTSKTVRDRLRDEALRQVRSRLLRGGLRLVLRDLGGPIYHAIRAWTFLGPAYRFTVPTILYVAYLRRRQLQAAA